MRDRDRMRVAEEPNVHVLRQKAAILEAENERLTRDLTTALRAMLAMRGMAPEAIELNLPGLVEQAKGRPSRLRAGVSERRAREGGDATEKQQRGHGPTEQLALAIKEETFDVDDADKKCTSCGGELSSWDGADDVVEVVDRIPAQWIIKKCTLKKYRCKCGGCVITADGPQKLIAGGRYTLDVALQSCVEKFVFHIPIERQARMAADVGMKITSQTLWDQQLRSSSRSTSTRFASSSSTATCSAPTSRHSCTSRRAAQGRRNYVGCRTERGMTVATTFYTVFESARVAGANPDAYLRYAARAILDNGDALLPHEWLARV